MARSRNIKPSFFDNDELAGCGIEAHFMFSGLWCYADREGRLEDRPLRIKARVMPYYDVDVDKLLGKLMRAGFILRYESGNNKYIQILTFTKHQNPHIKEAASTIPAPDNHQSSTVPATTQTGTSPADSLNPLTNSLNPSKKKNGQKHAFSDEDRITAIRICTKIKTLNPSAKPPNLDRWAEDIRKIRQLDDRTTDEIRTLFDWANTDDFWQTNILSPAKLRKQWDTLTIQMLHKGKKQEDHDGYTEYKPDRIDIAAEKIRELRERRAADD